MEIPGGRACWPKGIASAKALRQDVPGVLAAWQGGTEQMNKAGEGRWNLVGHWRIQELTRRESCPQ
jgi:hypothetical protein